MRAPDRRGVLAALAAVTCFRFSPKRHSADGVGLSFLALLFQTVCGQEGFVRAMLDMVLYKPPLFEFFQLAHFASTPALSNYRLHSSCLLTATTLY